MSNSITDTLRNLRGGELVDEASAALARVVNAVVDSGKAGKVTIELEVRRASRGAGAVTLRDRVSVKMPAVEAPETMLFATPEGALVVNDPRQRTLELKQVGDAAAAAANAG